MRLIHPHACVVHWLDCYTRLRCFVPNSNLQPAGTKAQQLSLLHGCSRGTSHKPAFPHPTLIHTVTPINNRRNTKTNTPRKEGARRLLESGAPQAQSKPYQPNTATFHAVMCCADDSELSKGHTDQHSYQESQNSPPTSFAVSCCAVSCCAVLCRRQGRL